MLPAPFWGATRLSASADQTKKSERANTAGSLRRLPQSLPRLSKVYSREAISGLDRFTRLPALPGSLLHQRLVSCGRGGLDPRLGKRFRPCHPVSYSGLNLFKGTDLDLAHALARN